MQSRARFSRLPEEGRFIEMTGWLGVPRLAMEEGHSCASS